MSIKHRVIAAGFGLFRVTRLHRFAGDFFRGSGVILMFHRIRPAQESEFAPNLLLEITPQFLDAVLGCLRENGLDIISLDEAAERISQPEARPFAALTFDDGFRDVVEFGLPILRRHDAPFCCYITPGLVDRTARLWWVELEEAIRRLDVVDLEIDGVRLSLPARNDMGKRAAYDQIYRLLRAGGESRLFETVATLRDRAGVDPVALVDSSCLGWDELRTLAKDPLVTLGAHSLTHPRLAYLTDDETLDEIAGSRIRLEKELGQKCRHFAYPYGDAGSAGAREFAIVRDQGFMTAVTTRPGMIFPEHANHLLALPRVAVNGLWQDIGMFETLLSGLPVALWNGGRRRVLV